MSEFWVFSITVGCWIFLVMGIIAGVIAMFVRGGIAGKIVGSAIGCLTVAILFAMYVYAVRGIP